MGWWRLHQNVTELGQPMRNRQPSALSYRVIVRKPNAASVASTSIRVFSVYIRRNWTKLVCHFFMFLLCSTVKIIARQADWFLMVYFVSIIARMCGCVLFAFLKNHSSTQRGRREQVRCHGHTKYSLATLWPPHIRLAFSWRLLGTLTTITRNR